MATSPDVGAKPSTPRPNVSELAIPSVKAAPSSDDLKTPVGNGNSPKKKSPPPPSKAGPGDKDKPKSAGMTMHGIFNKMASMKAVRPKVESTKKKGGLSLSLFKPKTGGAKKHSGGTTKPLSLGQKMKQSTLTGGIVKSKPKTPLSGKSKPSPGAEKGSPAKSNPFKDGMRQYVREEKKAYMAKYPDAPEQDILDRLKQKYRKLKPDQQTEYQKRAAKRLANLVGGSNDGRAQQSAPPTPTSPNSPTKSPRTGIPDSGERHLSASKITGSASDGLKPANAGNADAASDADAPDPVAAPAPAPAPAPSTSASSDTVANDDDSSDSDDEPIDMQGVKKKVSDKSRATKIRKRPPVTAESLFKQGDYVTAMKASEGWAALPAAEQKEKIAKAWNIYPSTKKEELKVKAEEMNEMRENNKLKKTLKQRGIGEFAVLKSGAPPKFALLPPRMQSKNQLAEQQRKNKLRTMSKSEKKEFLIEEKNAKKEALKEQKAQEREVREAARKEQRRRQKEEARRRKEAEELRNKPLEDSVPDSGMPNPELPNLPLPTTCSIPSRMDPKLYLDVIAISEFCLTYGNGLGNPEDDEEEPAAPSNSLAANVGKWWGFSGDYTCQLNELTPPKLEAAVTKQVGAISLPTILAHMLLRLLEPTADDGYMVRDGIAGMDTPLGIPMQDLAVNKDTASEILRLYLDCTDFGADVNVSEDPEYLMPVSPTKIMADAQEAAAAAAFAATSAAEELNGGPGNDPANDPDAEAPTVVEPSTAQGGSSRAADPSARPMPAECAAAEPAKPAEPASTPVVKMEMDTSVAQGDTAASAAPTTAASAEPASTPVVKMDMDAPVAPVEIAAPAAESKDSAMAAAPATAVDDSRSEALAVASDAAISTETPATAAAATKAATRVVVDTAMPATANAADTTVAAEEAESSADKVTVRVVPLHPPFTAFETAAPNAVKPETPATALTRSVLEKLRNTEFDMLPLPEMLHVLKFLCDRYCMHAELRKVMNDVDDNHRACRKQRREWEFEKNREAKKAKLAAKKGDNAAVPKVLTDEEMAQRFAEIEGRRQRVTRHKVESPEEKALREQQEAAIAKQNHIDEQNRLYEVNGQEMIRQADLLHGRILGVDRNMSQYQQMYGLPGLYVVASDGSVSMYNSPAALDELMGALNERGIRERDLLAKLGEFKDELIATLAEAKAAAATELPEPNPTPLADPNHELRETLKIFNKEMADGGFNEIDVQKLESADTPNDFASALLNLENNISANYLQKPLGKKKVKSNIKAFFESAVEVDGDEEDTVVVQAWRVYGEKAKTLAQVNLMYEMFYESINWEKSAKKIKCKVCRKKDNGDQMLLCDACDCAFHMYCCKPKVLQIPPEGVDWFCKSCSRARDKVIQQQQAMEDVLQQEQEEYDDMVSSSRGRKRTKVNYGDLFKNSDDEQDEEDTDDHEEDDDEEDVDEDEEDDEDEDEDDEIEVPDNCSWCSQAAENLEDDRMVVCQTCEKGSCLSCAGIKRMPRGGIWSCTECRSMQEHEDSMRKAEQKQKKRSGKDKSAKAEKKAKKSGKRKRQRTSSDEQASDEDGDEGDPNAGGKMGVRIELGLCENLLKELRRHKHATWFLEAVDIADVPDYYEIVSDPMDFEWMKRKCDNAEYTTVQQFVDDARLVFANCSKYNTPDNQVGKAGIELGKVFEKMYRSQIIKARKKRAKIDYSV